MIRILILPLAIGQGASGSENPLQYTVIADTEIIAHFSVSPSLIQVPSRGKSFDWFGSFCPIMFRSVGFIVSGFGRMDVYFEDFSTSFISTKTNLGAMFGRVTAISGVLLIRSAF